MHWAGSDGDCGTPKPKRILTAVDRDAILQSLRERILAFATSRVARDHAEDLTQDVLAVLHDKYPHVTELTELVPLAFQVLRFKMLDAHRKALRRGEYNQASLDDLPLADPADDPATQLDQQQRVDRLLTALAQLGERCRELFKWKLEGKSFPEIQTLMGQASINTIYTWDLRCRKQLLHLMGGSWE
jgi:RNA polymerase sigma-70 factor, ECF subfamily